MISEKLRRLRQMNAPEVKFRLAQRWRIQQEQWGFATNGAGANWTSCWNPAAVQHKILRERLEAGDATGAAALLPAYFTHRKGVSFFFDPAERNEIRVAHARSFPERLLSLQAEADKICAHRFRIFAYPEVSAGPRIAWRRDLVHGKEAPAEHWARVPYLDFERAGDSKIVWEPNRHQHFVTLSQAYFLTGEEKYAQECCEQWDDWLGENSRGRGINWSSSLELAFRLWSWCWTLHFLHGSAALNGERWAAISQSIAQHAEFIQQNLSTYFSPNTHLLGEGFALFVIGLMYPELHGAAEWREAGRAVLLEQMEKQVWADGWHIEQSSYYHRYAVDFFQCAAILAECNGCPFPASFTAKLARMYEVILHTQLPGGSQAMLGDADGGRLLPFSSPLSPEQSHDQRSALSTAAVYFSRAEFRAAAGALHEDTFWLLGRDASERWQAPAMPLQRPSTMFRDAGCVVMRSTSGTAERVLLFDAGPQGLAGCAHGHADALSFVCSADGEDWLVDPGTFVYTGSREWRQSFSGTQAHNTVIVDGRDQADPVDIFKWAAIPNVRLEKWRTSPSLDIAVASHDGYLRLERGVIHRRRIVFVKPRFWLITDELNGAGEHIAEFLFHFAPQTTLAQSGGKCAAARGEKCILLAASASTVAWETVEGDEGRRIGWYSADYGLRVAAPVACAKVRFTDSLRVDWLLAPGSLASDYDVVSSTDGITVRGKGGETTTLLTGSGAKNAALASDAEYLLHTTDMQDRTARVALLNGCCVSGQGSPLLAAESMLDAFEAVHERDGVHFLAQPTRRFRYFAPGVGNVTCNGKPAAFVRKGDWIEVAPN